MLAPRPTRPLACSAGCRPPGAPLCRPTRTMDRMPWRAASNPTPLGERMAPRWAPGLGWNAAAAPRTCRSRSWPAPHAPRPGCPTCCRGCAAKPVTIARRRWRTRMMAYGARRTARSLCGTGWLGLRSRLHPREHASNVARRRFGLVAPQRKALGLAVYKPLDSPEALT